LTPESLKDWVPTVGTLLAAVVGLTGMAIATRMPLLVVSEDGVGEGVFSPPTWCEDVFGLDANATESHAVGDFAMTVLPHGGCRRASRARDARSEGHEPY
jgi:hypothetical protein